MRRRGALALTALLGAAVVPGAAADVGTEPPDWAVALVRVGPDDPSATTVHWVIEYEPAAHGSDVVFGVSTADGSGVSGSLRHLEGPGAVVAASETAGGAEHVVVPGVMPAGRRVEGSWAVHAASSGRDAAIAFYVSNASIRVIDVHVEPDGVAPDVSVGRGTTALHSAGPDDDGTAVTAAVASGGVEVRHVEMAGGIIGAMDACIACIRTWKGPAGHTGRSTQVVAENGSVAFAGPGGGWTFNRTGVDGSYRAAGRSTLAVLAPIGRLWQHFDAAADRASTGAAG